MRSRDKPPVGTPLDYSSSLASGVVMAYAINEGSGTTLNDSAYGLYPASQPGSLTGTWEGSSRGGGFRFPGASVATFSSAAGKPLQSATNASLFIAGNATAAGGVNLQGGFGTASASTRFAIQKLNTNLFFCCGSATAMSIPFVAGDFSALITFDGTNPTQASRVVGYFNGVANTNSSTWPATLPSSFAISAGNSFRLGFMDGQSPDTGRAELVIAWNRTLSAAEAIALHTNPYSMFRQFVGWSDDQMWASYYQSVARRGLYMRAGSRGVA